MIRYLLDTNHVSAAMKHDPHLLRRMQAHADTEYGIGVPSIAELWFMIFNSARLAEDRKRLRVALRDYKRWPFGARTAIEFGKIKAELRKKGRPIRDVDIQIAAIARVHGLVLLTADVDFTAVDGIQIENWVTAAGP
jgi:tRNA(fMet)-specific endonuclease VapC